DPVVVALFTVRGRQAGTREVVKAGLMKKHDGGSAVPRLGRQILGVRPGNAAAQHDQEQQEAFHWSSPISQAMRISRKIAPMSNRAGGLSRWASGNPRRI